MFSLSETLLSATRIKKADAARLAELIIEYDEPREIVYEVVGMINTNINVETIVDDLSHDRLNWYASPFRKIVETRKQKDQMIEKPPEMREGEIECPKCKQKKTIIVEMQTRSADEGYTYFIHCLNEKCKAVTR